MRDFWIRRLRGLEDDEEGTSLTEFAIVLPIFVLVMTFIYHMGGVGNAITDAATGAQIDMWEGALPHHEFSHVPIDPAEATQPHTDPQRAANMALTHIDEYGMRQRDPDLLPPVGSNEVDTLRGLRRDGHWGESFERTRPADGQMNFVPLGGRNMTSTPGAVVGGSNYARTLVDDSGEGTTINYVFNRGLPPVLGAGIRYGSSHGVREGEVTFSGGWTLPVRSEFNVLVPPVPPPNAQFWAMQIAREQLDVYQPYNNLLGIDDHQPLLEAPAPSVPGEWSSTE